MIVAEGITKVVLFAWYKLDDQGNIVIWKVEREFL